MTSHVCRFNHERPLVSVYGEEERPVYFALSYTWGRWELQPDESPETEALDVANVSWRVPRIHPGRFTVAQFERVLHNIVSLFTVSAIPPSDDSGMREREVPLAEFVWLDVACIDQTPGSPMKAQEIGRQAKIFGGARHVFIWLHGIENMALRRAIEGLMIALNQASWIHVPGRRFPRARKGEALRGDEEFLSDAVRYLKVLLSDPWFSSLWTLQEAFLSPSAYIADREGTILAYIRPWKVVPAGTEGSILLQMHVLVSDLQDLAAICSQSIATKRKSGAESLNSSSLEEALLALIVGTGLSELFNSSAMALYTTATNRTTREPCDRIYGIMQVFDFRLGSSAEGADLQKAYTLPELEVQLGTELLNIMPIPSQIVTHMEVVPFGHAWRVQSTSKMPVLAQYFLYNGASSWFGEFEAMCEFSTCTAEGIVWGHFAGYTLPFGQLLRACRAINEGGRYR